MTNLEDLTQRMDAVERRLGMEAGLRASGDRDLGDLAASARAQQHLIQALAITQAQQNEKLDRHDAALAAAHGKLDRIVAMLGRLVGEGDA